MTIIPFAPAPKTERINGWPSEIIGNGFIHLYYHDYLDGDTAEYRDGFGDWYTVDAQPEDNEVFYIDIRED